MSRFYCPQPLEPGSEIELPTTVAHHLHVLRLAPGAPLRLFNGSGGEVQAELSSIEKRRATARIQTWIGREAELPYALTLAQALPEGSKMDWIIEKAVELGVAGVQPLAAARSVVRLDAERAARRQQHWEGVIIAAAEQCGRNRLAHLAPLSKLQDWLALPHLHKRVLLSPRAEQSLAAWARHQPPQALSLLVGPEGGFSDAEEAAALAAGAIALSMGPRVLRTETAGLAALAMLNAHWSPA
ncbi:16S rRNA (uracil(1498)-N(3))-methyltransferase [Massilia sp. TS11]|uniref:16S rRNA (uracil(1498)-N(3))-methyltransferase n=1 Tax=Massilia sp. TS11 TaxID=2908003 RepID=UPI001EDA6718|nr:16S rRNA (uracil(1498)-N(3))-methyltransferase [Massilia sp. TS11]MCG2585888.1 16S rRNA (uracil(1498)-N(3))-methyltransferase [Massilia sp. TS11]